jgi:hypothetical protein
VRQSASFGIEEGPVDGNHPKICPDRRDHRWEEANTIARPQRRLIVEPEFRRELTDGAAPQIALRQAVPEGGRCRPDAPSVAVGPFLPWLWFGKRRAAAIEQVAGTDAPASKRRNDLFVGTAGEAVKENGRPAKRHAERRAAIIMGGTDAHALAARP